MKRKKLVFILLSFLIPFLTLSIVFLINGYFSDKTIIYGDMYSQYYPLFTFLKGIFEGENSIFLTLNKNLGETMFGTFFYYLSSPLNIVLLLFKKIDYSLLFAFLIDIKISLCGLTMYLYMSHKYKKNDFTILVFSLCYAFMGYNLNYYINIMWLDVVLLSPIVLIGIDNIISNKSPILYITTLSISIFCNYYIAYMLCIFCILYFIYEVLTNLNLKEKKRLLHLFSRFVISSLLAGLMCSFFLIPCLYESTYYSRTLDLESIFQFDYNFLDLFSKSYIGAIGTSDILNYSSMNTYCGIIMLPLVYFYFSNRFISKKEKKYSLILIIIMILPCFIFPLNYIWHLFSKPSFYSFRYSFLLCLFLINLGYKSYSKLDINKKYIPLFISLYMLISAYFIILNFYGNYYKSLKLVNVFITTIFLIIYMLVLLIKNKKMRTIFICVVLLVENILNVSLIFKKYDKNKKTILSTDTYAEIIKKYSGGRLVFEPSYTYNDSILLKYNGISSFLSTSDNKIKRFLFRMSYLEDTEDNIYFHRNESHILDSMIGLKYIISSKKLNNYKLIDTINYSDNWLTDQIYIYENPNALSIGYMINNTCNNIQYSTDYDQKVFNCLIGKENLYYKDYNIAISDNNINVKIDKNYSVYIYYPELIKHNPQLENISLIDYSDNYIIFNNNSENVNMKFDDPIDIEKLKVYYFDYSRFSSDVKRNIKEQLYYTIDNDKIIGDMETDGGIMMLTIPYEKGLEISVDGEKTNYFKVADTFVGINLTKGTHHIEINYKQPLLAIGTYITIISFILLIIYVNKTSKYNQKL